VWRVVDINNIKLNSNTKFSDLRAMAKSAVDRSEGQLREFAGKFLITDELMQYIVERGVLSFVTCLQL
jgi:hypothetical protein